MGTASESQLIQLEKVIGAMSLEEIAVDAASELGVSWQDLKKVVQSSKLAMTSRSFAKVVRRFAKKLEEDEVDEIILKLKLSMVPISNMRIWHTIIMSEKIFPEEPIANMVRLLNMRILHAMKLIRGLPNARAKVHSKKFGDFIYFSLQIVVPNKKSNTLYLALAPNEIVVFVSTLANKKLIQAAVQGIGYKKYSNANLNGPDIVSLLHIADRTWNTSNVNRLLTDVPEYAPKPIRTKNGFDFTNKVYNENYVDSLLGPNPPLLTHLQITSRKPFFNSTVLNKKMNITIKLKSRNLADTLKSWVVDKTLAPTSEFLSIFTAMKSNMICDDSDEEN